MIWIAPSEKDDANDALEMRLTEMFPTRTDLPKTLIFAKRACPERSRRNTHADDIVRICREVFGKGNGFCKKITYRTGFVRIVEKNPQADGSELRGNHMETHLQPVPRRNPQRLSHGPARLQRLPVPSITLC